MLGPRPFPKTLVRDLQGLARLLYRAEQDVDMPDSYGRLGRLEEAGRAFGNALDLDRRSPGNRSAWTYARKGVVILNECIRGQPELENLVRVAAAPFTRR